MNKERLYASKFKPIYGTLTNGKQYVLKYEAIEWDTAANIRASCTSCQDKSYPVDHFGSSMCRCGSIASGGSNAHCTCSSCF